MYLKVSLQAAAWVVVAQPGGSGEDGSQHSLQGFVPRHFALRFYHSLPPVALSCSKPILVVRVTVCGVCLGVLIAVLLSTACKVCCSILNSQIIERLL